MVWCEKPIKICQVSKVLLVMISYSRMICSASRVVIPENYLYKCDRFATSKEREICLEADLDKLMDIRQEI